MSANVTQNDANEPEPIGLASDLTSADMRARLKSNSKSEPCIRVRVVMNDGYEPELIGMEGDLAGVDHELLGGKCTVFLDDDKMPTSFPANELVILDANGRPERGWVELRPTARERLSDLAHRA